MSEIYLIDLFCGCGGFSQGAVQAGCKPVLAIDSWKEALDVHETNHPNCVHWHHTLGGDVEEFVCSIQTFIDLNLPENCHLHIHASPPCQTLSLANKKRNDSGVSMIDWTLEVIHLLSPTSWSLENVVHPKVIQQYENCNIFRMWNYGVPQKRKRMIMTNVDTSTMRTDEGGNVLDIVTRFRPEIDWGNCEMTPSGGPWRNCQSMNNPSYTILARPPMVRHKLSQKTFRMSVKETAAIQTFPESYVFPNTTFSYSVIGNAVPPQFAQRFMECI